MARSLPKLLLLLVALSLTGAPALAADADAFARQQSLIRLLVKAGRNEEAAAAMRSLYPSGPPVGGPLALEYYDVIGNTDKGREEATQALERLVKAAPDDIGYRLALARQLTRRADTRGKGLQLFADLAAKPGAGRQQVLGEWRGVLVHLSYKAENIPAFKAYLAADPESVPIRDALTTAQRAEAVQLPWELRDQADAQLAAGHPDQAMATLKRALQLDPRNPWVRFDLARLTQKQGDMAGGRRVMEAGLTAAPGNADMLYANALFVGLLDEADNALRLLGRIPSRQRTPAMEHLRKQMNITRQTERALAASQAGNTGKMQTTMRHAEADAGDDPELAYVVADGWVNVGQPARGVELMRRFGARPDATLDTLLNYGKILNRAERSDELGAVLQRISAFRKFSPHQSEDLRYLQSSLASHRADDLRHQGKIEQARAVLKPVLAQYPQDTDMLMAMARVHEAAGEQNQARAIYLDILQRDPGNAGARRALDLMAAKTKEVASTLPSRRAQGYVGAAVDYLSKGGGSPGISNLRIIETPVEARIPVGESGGRLFAQVDPANANAGPLASASLGDLRQYGKVMALSPNGLANLPGQSAHGTAVALGYENEHLRADIGSTPIGFPVSNIVGGVKWSKYTAISGYSVDVSRRPVISSLISYAGAQDPVTGQVWGGVVSTGASGHVGHDFGKLNLFLEPGYYRITGQNMPGNSEVALRTGFNWAFIDNDDMLLKGGVALTYWHYQENLRFYTFGQGGYYSPQRYVSLAPNFRWTGREERWSYMVQGAVSIAYVYENNSLYYPTDPALQAQAAAQAAALTLAPPIYIGGSSHNTGHSLGAAVEYRFTPRLYGGALGQIDRSTYYTPNYAVFYLRYMFDAQTGPVPYPPEPVKAYSRY
jgi:tetratricopeptide (TPR) repeat protein